MSPEKCFNIAHFVVVLMTLLSLVTRFLPAYGQYDCNFYDRSCPRLTAIVRAGVRAAIRNDRRMAASLLRMHFHDCFVNGCDASVLLDDTDDFVGEKHALPNNNSLRGYEVIDRIKANVEKACPLTVSCADIVPLVAREAVIWSGGPHWSVPLGRRDGLTAASDQDVVAQLPSPFESVEKITAKFTSKGLELKDVVVLSGAHTIGFAQCFVFKTRLFNFNLSGKPDPKVNPSFLPVLQGKCPDQDSSNTNLVPLDSSSSFRFDNLYYSNLMNNIGLLGSDQSLMGDPLTASMVRSYSENPHLFSSDFAASMVKMGNIGILTGDDGEIRKKCGSVNDLEF